MAIQYTCPKCKETMEVGLDSNILLLDEECNNCHTKISDKEMDRIYSDALIDDSSSRIDQAKDYLVDNVYNYSIGRD